MIKTYTDGATITAILEVDPMPSYTFGPDASKIRYKEPYVSEAQDLKDSGIIPVGIYNGYTPLAVGSNNLSINVDVTRGDSVAVVETRTGKYNLTVRTTSNVLLEDFTLVAFPALVVLRTDYSLTASPLAGMTSSKILVVDPALDDTDADHLNTGDIKICRVTGLAGGGVVLFTVIPVTDRNIGSLALQGQAYSQIESKTSISGPYTTPSVAFVVLPDTQILFSLVYPQSVFILANGQGAISAFNVTDVQIGIRVDGVDYPGDMVTGSPTTPYTHAGLHLAALVSLAAGAHSAEIIYRCISGGAYTGKIYSTAAYPTKLFIMHKG
jgi:hypothetical protein